ncbi:hypothetical protein CHU98_g9566 [Xylaria longipes]|nr:hypothetical protein CHU98_g9566 [Xylaria longipes]
MPHARDGRLALFTPNPTQRAGSKVQKHNARLDTPETGAWAMAVAQFWGFESMVGLLVQEGVEKGAVLSRSPKRRELFLFFPGAYFRKKEEFLSILSWFALALLTSFYSAFKKLPYALPRHELSFRT